MTDGSSDDCDFCAIARHEDTSVEVVAEGSEWIAFFPLEPATPGHTMVIPKAHVRDYWEGDVGLVQDVSTALLRVGQAIQRAVSPEGMNMITSAGSAAEQTVFHLHIHLVPRWTRDGFGKIWPVESKYEDDQLVDVAARIASEFEAGASR